MTTPPATTPPARTATAATTSPARTATAPANETPLAAAAAGSASSAVHTGWHLFAFLSELTGNLTPLAIGPRRLMAVRQHDEVRLFDANCPHRGAHLGIGGTVDGDCVICPFHGKRITLGDTTGRRWAVREHPVLRWGQALFTRLGQDDADDRGLPAALAAFDATHPLVAALTRDIAAPAELIVENAFDGDHFTALHKVPKVGGMQTRPGEAGELVIEGEFFMQTSPWQDDRAKEAVRWEAVRTGVVRWDYRPRFLARAFSPGVVVTEFGPPGRTHVIVTAAVPTATGCTARVAIGVSAGHEAELPMLIAGSHKAIGEDISIWENLDLTAEPHYDAGDRPVLAFKAFCAGFGRLA
ncbi:Rieske 2Fe-2S domain-containing protein [Streptomyces sp. NPDC048416]|uniref:Rieske 2Fe-2S domain-containing protein n=1 Tax=Streptomyces sp. NPDC048416 TaxID=3365546 RepID=UPI00371ED7C1